LTTIETSPRSTANRSEIAIRELLAELIYKKRQSAAEAVSQLSGMPISLDMMNSYTRADKGARLPAILVEPLCELFDDDRLLLLLMRPRLRKLLALGRAAAEVLDERAQKHLVARSTKLRAGKKTKGVCAR
jgi:hypothetical protein